MKQVKRVKELPKGEIISCRHCGQPIEKNSTFCRHCGSRHAQIAYQHGKKCPHCKGLVEQAATFCPHCGVHFDHYHKHTIIRSLTTIIVLLVVVLFLVVGFNLLKDRFVQQQKQVDVGVIAPHASVLIKDASCVWEKGNYKICETVNWFGGEGYYAKAYIPGGESLEVSQPYADTSFAYCQKVGSDDGYRVVKAVVYDAQGGLVQDTGEGIQCQGKPQNEAIQTVTFTKHYSLLTKPDLGRPRGEGTETIELNQEPESCTVDGMWRTDNSPFGLQGHIGGFTQYCDKATGTFTGYVDKNQQYVNNDADIFRWAGPRELEFNPPPQRFDGWFLYMYTCDWQYYRMDARGSKRYYVRAQVVDFSKNMKVHWEYLNDDTHPVIDFIFTLTCKGKK